MITSLWVLQGVVGNRTAIGWGLARGIFHHHQLVSCHPQKGDGITTAASTTWAEHAAACDLPEDAALLKATFHGWRYKHYFEFVECKENNLTVRCTLCPCWKLLSTAANATSNLTSTYSDSTHTQSLLLMNGGATSMRCPVSMHKNVMSNIFESNV